MRSTANDIGRRKSCQEPCEPFATLGLGAGLAAGVGISCRYEHPHGGTARAYFRVVAIAYVLLAALGLISATKTTFGLVPIWGNDVYLHALLALGAIYFGSITPATPAQAHR